MCRRRKWHREHHSARSRPPHPNIDEPRDDHGIYRAHFPPKTVTPPCQVAAFSASVIGTASRHRHASQSHLRNRSTRLIYDDSNIHGVARRQTRHSAPGAPTIDIRWKRRSDRGESVSSALLDGPKKRALRFPEDTQRQRNCRHPSRTHATILMTRNASLCDGSATNQAPSAGSNRPGDLEALSLLTHRAAASPTSSVNTNGVPTRLTRNSWQSRCIYPIDYDAKTEVSRRTCLSGHAESACL